MSEKMRTPRKERTQTHQHSSTDQDKKLRSLEWWTQAKAEGLYKMIKSGLESWLRGKSPCDCCRGFGFNLQHHKEAHHLWGKQAQMWWPKDMQAKHTYMQNIKNTYIFLKFKDQMSLLNFRCQTCTCYLTKNDFIKISLLVTRLSGEYTSMELVLVVELPESQETPGKHFIQRKVIFTQYPPKLKDCP